MEPRTLYWIPTSRDFWQLTTKYVLRCCDFQSCSPIPKMSFRFLFAISHDPNANQALQDDLNFSAGAGWGKKSRAFSGRWAKGCRCWGLIGTFHCIGDSQSFSLLKIHKDVWFGVLRNAFWLFHWWQAEFFEAAGSSPDLSRQLFLPVKPCPVCGSCPGSRQNPGRDAVRHVRMGSKGLLVIITVYEYHMNIYGLYINNFFKWIILIH